MTATELVQKAIEIGTSASGFPLTLSEDERKALFALSLEWGGKRILGAWKLYQDDPGKARKALPLLSGGLSPLPSPYRRLAP
jgi:hypothetical protein